MIDYNNGIALYDVKSGNIFFIITKNGEKTSLHEYENLKPYLFKLTKKLSKHKLYDYKKLIEAKL